MTNFQPAPSITLHEIATLPPRLETVRFTSGGGFASCLETGSLQITPVFREAYSLDDNSLSLDEIIVQESNSGRLAVISNIPRVRGLEVISDIISDGTMNFSAAIAHLQHLATSNEYSGVRVAEYTHPSIKNELSDATELVRVSLPFRKTELPEFDTFKRRLDDIPFFDPDIFLWRHEVRQGKRFVDTVVVDTIVGHNRHEKTWNLESNGREYIYRMASSIVGGTILPHEYNERGQPIHLFVSEGVHFVGNNGTHRTAALKGLNGGLSLRAEITPVEVSSEGKRVLERLKGSQPLDL